MSDEAQPSLDDYEAELNRDLENATGRVEGDWFSVFEKAGVRLGKLGLLADTLAETGHWRHDFTVAVMAGAYCEYYLRKLTDCGPDTYVPFEALVRRARSSGVLPERLQKPLKAFARLRNRFAHNIDYRLSENDKKVLDSTLDSAMREEIENYLAEAVANKKKATPLESYFRFFASAIIDELERTLRSHEATEDSFR
jgi:hypothetical protein